MRALRRERLPALAGEDAPCSAGTRASRSRPRACRAARAPRCRSRRAACRASVSTRETKKLATDAHLSTGRRRASTSRSSPRMYASITSPCRSQREDQRDVDVAAARDHLLDRADSPGSSPGSSRSRFGRSIQLVEALRLGDRPLAVVRERRGRPPTRRSRPRRSPRPRPGAAGRTPRRRRRPASARKISFGSSSCSSSSRSCSS